MKKELDRNEKFHIDYQIFENKYSSEKDCRIHLRDWKWPDGFECSECGHTKKYKYKKHSHQSKRHNITYQCKKCHNQTSLTTDTILEKTRLTLLDWFKMIYFTPKGYPLRIVKKILAVKNYKTIWTMKEKIKKALKKKSTYELLLGIARKKDIEKYQKKHGLNLKIEKRGAKKKK